TLFERSTELYRRALEPSQREAQDVQRQIDARRNASTADMQGWLDQLSRISAAQDKIKHETKAVDGLLLQVYWSCAGVWTQAAQTGGEPSFPPVWLPAVTPAPSVAAPEPLCQEVDGVLVCKRTGPPRR